MTIASRVAGTVLWRCRTWVVGSLLVGLTATLIVLTVFTSEMKVAYERVRGRTTVVSSPYGDIEFREGGRGTAVLIVHGAGGGFDQGELIAQAVLDERFRWIAPSRFGYLRSTFKAGATYDEQAHAYARLLDHLQVGQVAVVAMSSGGPSGLLLAVLYPERVSSLTLLSTGVTPVVTENQAQANRMGKMWVRIFGNDFLFWLAATLFKAQIMQLMGAERSVVAALDTEQRNLVTRVIDYMHPVSLRSLGTVVDNTFTLPGERITAIRAPTLVVHAEDDTLQLYQNATFAAAKIPTARLLRFERGGHLVTMIEQPTVRAAVQRHILDNTRVPHGVPNPGLGDVR